MQLEDIDLTRLADFGGDMPHDWFTFLRQEAPVWYHPAVEEAPELNGEGFWVLSKYDEIVTANRDWRSYSAATGPGREGGGIMISDVEASGVMIMMDPPRQQRMRRLVNQGFSPRGVRRLEKYCRELARELFDAVIEKGECEFVADIAAELPLQVVAEILGVPREDRREVFTWTNQFLDDSVPEMQQLAAIQSIYNYAQRLGAEKRAHPTDDIFSGIVHAEIEDANGQPQRLTEMEIAHLFQLIATGGSETTRNSISGGLLALLENPDQLALLRGNPAMLPRATEEILRWTSPVNYFRRTATRDTELGGQKIRAGEKVTLWYCSGNRDEDVFADPFRFDITRWPNNHLTFGAGGAHYCLGANLAKMEIELTFAELLRRISDIEVAGPVERFYTRWYINVFGGYRKLPIRFSAR